MKRWKLTVVFALTLGGCIVDDGSGSGGTYTPAQNCAAYVTCGTCTPVLGCGWCSVGAAGVCVTDPDQCAGAPAFSWTWVQSGCPGEADGGTSTDGAADGGVTD